jgi:acetyl esterase/lipase
VDLRKDEIKWSSYREVHPAVEDFTLEDFEKNNLKIRRGPNPKGIWLRELSPFESEEETAKSSWLLVYLYGGGFISLSTFMAEGNGRIWAKEMRVPVVMVEYSRAPGQPFPHAVNDCFRAYVHLRESHPRRKIVVVGDSAGGNLACATAGLSMHNGLPPPDLLLLNYPAMYVGVRYSPCMHFSFENNFLPLNLMLAILEAYLGPRKHLCEHPIVSPFYMNEGLERGRSDKPWPQHWPRSIVVLAEKDGLCDSAL